VRRKEAIDLDAFRTAYARHFVPLKRLGHGIAGEMQHDSQLHTSWTELACISETRKIEVTAVLFTSALFGGPLEGSIGLSLVRKAPDVTDDYLEFSLFLKAHGFGDLN